MLTPFIPGWDPIRGEEKRMKKQEYKCNVQTGSVSSVPLPLNSIPLLLLNHIVFTVIRV